MSDIPFSIEPVSGQKVYDQAALEPVPVTDTQSLTNAINALVEQIIEAKEAEMKEDLYEMMSEAQASVLDIAPADTQTSADAAKGGETMRGDGEQSAASSADTSTAKPDAQGAQSTAAVQAHSAVNSPAFVAGLTAAMPIVTPAEDAGEALAPVASV